MNVLFVAPGILEVPNSIGGAIEQNIFELAEFSPRTSTVLSPRISGHRIQKTGTGQSNIVYSFVPATKTYPRPPHLSLCNIVDYLRGLIFHLDAAIKILVLNKKINVVVVFSMPFGTIPLLVALLTKKKRVFMEYNIWPWTYDGHYRSTVFRLQLAFGKMISKLSSIVTANSPSIMDGMTSKGIPRSKIFLVPTGINLPNIKNFRKQLMNPSVLYVGRLVEERGAAMLPSIIREVLHNRNDVQFTIIGDGPLFGEINNFVKRNHFGKNVELLGHLHRSKVAKKIDTSTVAIFISENENFGSMALLECMAAGCPVIATDVGSTSKLVKNGINGILTKPEGNSIAESILTFFKQPHFDEIMVEKSLQTAREYSWEVISHNFAEILSGIL